MNGREVEFLYDILLVEDNSADSFLIQETFDQCKTFTRLSVVSDGEEATDYLRRHGQYLEAARPHLILLDLNLPKKDGREVLRDIKTDPALMTIPVVVLTTSTSDKDIQRVYDLHANCYLAKPLDMEDFLVVVRRLEEFWLMLARLPY